MKLCRNDPLNFLPFTVDEIPHEDFSEDEEDDEFDDVNEDDDERLNFYTASFTCYALCAVWKGKIWHLIQERKARTKGNRVILVEVRHLFQV